MKEITSVDKTLVKNILIRELLPAILQKFPKDTKEINIQLDNASPHIKDDDVDWRQAVDKCGVKVKIRNQPENSPDLNVLDLGYFNAIQSLQQQRRSTSIEELVENVQQSYNDLSINQLHNIWITWQLVMLRVIECDGDNTYVLPRKNRGVLERDGILKTTVVVGDDLMKKIDDDITLENQKLITGYFRMKTRSITKCLIRL